MTRRQAEPGDRTFPHAVERPSALRGQRGHRPIPLREPRPHVLGRQFHPRPDRGRHDVRRRLDVAEEGPEFLRRVRPRRKFDRGLMNHQNRRRDRVAGGAGLEHEERGGLGVPEDEAPDGPAEGAQPVVDAPGRVRVAAARVDEHHIRRGLEGRPRERALPEGGGGGVIDLPEDREGRDARAPGTSHVKGDGLLDGRRRGHDRGGAKRVTGAGANEQQAEKCNETYHREPPCRFKCLVIVTRIG
jgi:hypothetical protein